MKPASQYCRQLTGIVSVGVAALLIMFSAGCTQSGSNGLLTSSIGSGATKPQLAQAYMDCLVESYYYHGGNSAAIDRAVGSCKPAGRAYTASVVRDYRSKPSHVAFNVDNIMYPRIEKRGRRYLQQIVEG